MRPISIGQLHRMTGKAIAALPGPVPIKSGDRVIALLLPARMEKAVPAEPTAVAEPAGS